MKDDTVRETVEDVFAKKATSTLRSRASAMWLLLRWLSASTGSATPLSEDRVYMYASYCRSVGKAATRLEQLLQAIAFCKGLIGLRGTSEILESARVSGAAHRLFMTKRILRQHAALKRRQCALLDQRLWS